MKNAVNDLSTTIASHTAQLPPPSIYIGLISSLDEINKSLHNLNSSGAAAETAAILREVQSSLARKESQPPSSDTDELKSLLGDVRSALNNNDRTPRITQSAHLSSYSPFGLAKRRREVIPSAEQPKRAKTDIVATGPVNSDLTTVAKPSDEPAGFKSMVASRFAPQTDASKIVSHVKSNLSIEADSDVVFVRSLAPRGRPLAELTFVSFKVTVPEEHIGKLMDPSFWPANTTIREFEQRVNVKTADFC